MIKGHKRSHGANVPSGQKIVVHHWTQGQQDVLKVAPFSARRSDGYHPYEWKFYWYLDRVEGTTRGQALTAINGVLRHAKSWERTGVRWVRTQNKKKANILVSVIPEKTTYCGRNAAGCYCEDCERQPTAELGVEYLGSSSFAEVVNMELCGHGTFRMHDMYAGPGHSSYQGVMGTWASAEKTHYYPTADEIRWAKLWLQGQAQYVHQHG